MSLKFKSVDFKKNIQIAGRSRYEYLTQDQAAVNAQEIFDKWLESQPKVYCTYNMISDEMAEWGAYKANNNTHQARLVAIEPIKKCEHPEVYFNNMDMVLTKIPPIHKPIGWYCTKCQEPMKPSTWEQVKSDE